MLERSNRKTIIIFVIAVFLLAGSYLINKPKDGKINPKDYRINEILYGTNVSSKIPLENVSSWNDLTLYKSNVPGAVACNLEFSVLKPNSLGGAYAIVIEEGISGVFIDETKATIRGLDDSDRIYNCHVLSCLLMNLTCPENLDEIKKIIWYTNDLNVVVDSRIKASSMGAYAELMGPLGFHQMMKADFNKDGKVDDTERAANKVLIYPYFKFNDSCRLQPIKNMVQELNASNNVTRDCNISPGIYLEESNVSEIKIVGNKIYLRGDSITLRAEAIITGNIIAPDWITSFRQAK